ncbi:hypothetical protein D9M71_551250 [compost metagenome]
MVRAGDDVLRLAVALQQLVATVRADVVESAQLAVAATHDDDALADVCAGDVGVVLGDFAAVADADPAVGEDLFLLELEDLRPGVVAGGNGVGLIGIGAEVGGEALDIVHLLYSRHLGRRPEPGHHSYLLMVNTNLSVNRSGKIFWPQAVGWVGAPRATRHPSGMMGIAPLHPSYEAAHPCAGMATTQLIAQ